MNKIQKTTSWSYQIGFYNHNMAKLIGNEYLSTREKHALLEKVNMFFCKEYTKSMRGFKKELIIKVDTLDKPTRDTSIFEDLS